MSILADPELWISLFHEKSESPSQQFRFDLEQKRLRYTNVILVKGTITDQKNNKVIAELDPQQNPRDFWFTWLQVPIFRPDQNYSGQRPAPGRVEYKEFLLTRGVKSGAVLISTEEDDKVYEISTPYEWRDAKLSPCGTKLAITCHRAKDSKDCKPVRVFDFSDPSNVPYKELPLTHFPQLEGMKEYRSEIEWIDDNSIKVTLPVYCGNTPYALGYDYCSEDIILSLKHPTSGLSQLRSVQKH